MSRHRWGLAGRRQPLARQVSGRAPEMVLLVAAGTTAFASPAVRALLLNRGVLDVPNHRSSHVQPVPRGGGIACSAGVLAGGVAAAVARMPTPFGALIGAGALALVGLVDDRRSLPPGPRLAAQAIVGAALGLRMPNLTAHTALGGAVLPVCVNVVNFMDGINGITSATMTVFGVSAMSSGRRHDVGALSTLGALTAGAALGFLPWNAPHAKMFLGDVGSYLFGGLAGTALLLSRRGGWVAAAPVAASLSIYLADTSAALVSRAARHEPLTEAHRDHVYQRLVDDHGWSHGRTAGLASGLAGISALAWSRLRPGPAAAVTAGTVAAYLALPALLRRSKGTGVRRRHDSTLWLRREAAAPRRCGGAKGRTARAGSQEK